jgi:hypothetical protein
MDCQTHSVATIINTDLEHHRGIPVTREWNFRIATCLQRSLAEPLPNVKGTSRNRVMKRRIFRQHTLTEVEERLRALVGG